MSFLKEIKTVNKNCVGVGAVFISVDLSSVAFIAISLDIVFAI